MNASLKNLNITELRCALSNNEIALQYDEISQKGFNIIKGRILAEIARREQLNENHEQQRNKI